MVAVIWKKRSFPVYWQFLDKAGSSNISEQIGIESLFKDCKTGGYNLEGTKACIERLNRLVLLIAMAYTIASLFIYSTV